MKWGRHNLQRHQNLLLAGRRYRFTIKINKLNTDKNLSYRQIKRSLVEVLIKGHVTTAVLKGAKECIEHTHVKVDWPWFGFRVDFLTFRHHRHVFYNILMKKNGFVDQSHGLQIAAAFPRQQTDISAGALVAILCLRWLAKSTCVWESTLFMMVFGIQPCGGNRKSKSV